MSKSERGIFPNDVYHNPKVWEKVVRNVRAKELGVAPESLGVLMEIQEDGDGNIVSEKPFYPVKPSRQDIGHP